jgi:hypothetical protein
MLSGPHIRSCSSKSDIRPVSHQLKYLGLHSGRWGKKTSPFSTILAQSLIEAKLLAELNHIPVENAERGEALIPLDRR